MTLTASSRTLSLISHRPELQEWVQAAHHLTQRTKSHPTSHQVRLKKPKRRANSLIQAKDWTITMIISQCLASLKTPCQICSKKRNELQINLPAQCLSTNRIQQWVKVHQELDSGQLQTHLEALLLELQVSQLSRIALTESSKTTLMAVVLQIKTCRAVMIGRTIHSGMNEVKDFVLINGARMHRGCISPVTGRES